VDSIEMTASSVHESGDEDGRIILGEWLKSPVGNDDGEDLVVLTMTQYFTDRKRVEAPLRMSDGPLSRDLPIATVRSTSSPRRRDQ
jgi:hypothetical protein